MKRTSLAAIGAVLAVISLSGCSDDPPAVAPATSVATSASEPATESPSPSVPDASATGEVTEAQKKACLDAIVEQIRAKKGGDKPQECAVLPDAVLGEIIEKALSGG